MCERCESLSEVVVLKVKAPIWVCDWCGEEVKDMIECPECEVGEMIDVSNSSDIKCTKCNHVEEGVCSNGSCSI